MMQVKLIEKVMEERLTKENFWNRIYDMYPTGTQVFCDWIDVYKKKVGWQELFRDGIKFHDVPYAIQMGIWMAFTNDMYVKGRFPWNPDEMTTFDLAHDITEYIAMVESEIVND